MKKTIIAAIMALLCAAAFAQNAASDFAIDANGVITKYNGWDAAVVIPETVNGIRVTKIGEKAFSGNDLTSVTIPRGVTSIGSGAFSPNKLTRVSIPDSVTSIGSSAFSRNRLASVTIPGNNVNIGYSAFSSNQLASVTIPGNNVNIGYRAFNDNPITSITLGRNHEFSAEVVPRRNNNLYEGSLFYDYVCNDRKAGTYTTNKEVGSANNEADFQYIYTQYGAFITGYTGSAGNRLEIPSRLGNLPVKAIGWLDNKGISRVRIPDSVTYIGGSAFSNNKLTEVTIPNSVTYIGGSAFSNNKLTNVTIPDSVTTIGNYAFYNNQLTSVVIPDSVTSIGNSAFDSNPLTSVTIGSNVPISSSSFPSGFDSAYNANGKTAETYTRSGTNSSDWATREVAQQRKEQEAQQAQQRQQQQAQQAKARELERELGTIYRSIRGNSISRGDFPKVVQYYQLFQQLKEVEKEVDKNAFQNYSRDFNELAGKLSRSQKNDFLKQFPGSIR